MWIRTDSPKRIFFCKSFPVSDAEFMLTNQCENDIIEKNRYLIKYNTHTWEVDEFLSFNKGLIIAEIELENEEEAFEKPEWLGKEVSGEHKYYNSNLSKHPFTKW